MAPLKLVRPNQPPRNLMISIAIALLLAFLALAFVDGSTILVGQITYALSAVILAAAAAATARALLPPSRWAAVSALGGLIATEVFAATEIGAAAPSEWDGVGALIVPAWLFAAVGWWTHMLAVRSLRWVTTLVQVSFTSLSSALFVILTFQADSPTEAFGFGLAAVLGLSSAALAITSVIQRVLLELRLRSA